MNFGATTLPGLEAVAKNELLAFGVELREQSPGFLSFEAPESILSDLVQRSRHLIRVLVPIVSGTVRSADELGRQLAGILWTEVLQSETSFRVDLVGKAAFAANRYLPLVVKDQIADAFARAKRPRPAVDTKRPQHLFVLHVDGHEYSLFRDAAGAPLSARGYRTQTLDAPMNEVLAASLPRILGFEGTGLLIDPMTGSGTIPIEAARGCAGSIQAMRPQGFALENWPDRKRFGWPIGNPGSTKPDPALAAAKLDREIVRIIGADKDPKFRSVAEANARAAGLGEHSIHWTCEPFEYLHADPELRDARAWAESKNLPVFLCINPPFDERLKLEDASDFYRSIGDLLKVHWKGARAGVFTSNLQAAKSLGLRSSARIPIKNGPLDCRFIIYDLY